jgi:hypothetical protein
MDLTQKKLIKTEWEALEVPVQQREKEILDMIANSYENIHYTYNKNKSMMSIMNLKDTENNTVSNYLYEKYFEKNVSALCKQYDISFTVKKNSKTKKLKKVDKMKIDNVDSKIQQVKDEIFEFTIIEIIVNLLKYSTQTGKKSTLGFHMNYYTLYHIMKFNITRKLPLVIEFSQKLLDIYISQIDLLYIVNHSFDIIERNKYLLKYADMQLYEHQKQIFSIMKNKHSKVVLYQAPTGTGKTITPIGLTKGNKVIFVCAAKHVGLQLAKACISMDIPLAIAFGCNDPGDIRLHYNAAKDVVRNFKTGGIFRVDNTVGDKVEIIVCDVKSYLPAMHYMLAFNKNHEIITYWDEPTISLDYDEHEFHPILQKNWLENEIPNVVLSSATLPNQNDIHKMMDYFKIRFNGAQVYNIISHDCKKTIPIMSVEGDIVLPHIICKTGKELKQCMDHCKQFKTILRHFDLNEIISFISYIHENNLLVRERYHIKEYFNDISDIHSISIKEYYLDLLASLKKNWDKIYESYMESHNVNMMKSNIYITTKDAHTLTDGPTIYIADDVDKLAKVLLKLSNIPTDQVEKISENIQFNEQIRKKIDETDHELKEYTDKIMNSNGKKDDDKDKKSSRIDMKDPTIKKLNNQIQTLGNCLKSVNLNEMFIPNTPEHLERFGKSNVKNAFTCDIGESVIENIMMTSVEPIWKVLLLLGIGVFRSHKDVKYLEIMKTLALQQRLYVIIATSDFIYGTNYQFCHGYIGKDLENMTQEKVIQAFGRVGRNSTQMDYSIRLRNNELIKKIFFKEEDKKEVRNMNALFGIPPNQEQVMKINVQYEVAHEIAKEFQKQKKVKETELSSPKRVSSQENLVPFSWEDGIDWEGSDSE